MWLYLSNLLSGCIGHPHAESDVAGSQSITEIKQQHVAEERKERQLPHLPKQNHKAKLQSNGMAPRFTGEKHRAHGDSQSTYSIDMR